MSIRGRIALVSAAAVAVAVVLISIGTFIGARNQVMAQIDDSLLMRASAIGEMRPVAILGLLGVERGDGARGRIVPPRRGDFDASYYQVILSDDRVVNIGDDDLVLPEPDRGDLTRTRPTLRSEGVDGVHLRIVTTVVGQGGIIVQIARPLTEADAAMGRLAVVLFAGGVIGIALAGGLGLLVASQAVKPISALTRTVGAIAATQDFSERVDVEGDDEISELASEFNTLLNELESSQQEQVRLVRDAGHELRTPLTALRTNLEILQRHELSPEERTTTLAAAHAEIEELAALVAEVVDLATDRYEEEALDPVDLSEVVEAVAERYQKRRGRLVTVAADKSRVVGKRQAIERAVLNLVANADKFSPVGDPITIDVTRGVITVTDTGSGIDSHDLPHVFERFFRSDTARSQPGSGLGLSIVKAIVDDHGGDVFARNRASGGAEVGFSLTVDR